MSKKTVTFDGTYGTLAKPTRTGYTFDGWFTSLKGGNRKQSSSKVTTASNHTLYAHWTANKYKVTFDSTIIKYAHYPELCLAWLTSYKGTFKKLTK